MNIVLIFRSTFNSTAFDLTEDLKNYFSIVLIDLKDYLGWGYYNNTNKVVRNKYT